MIIIYFKIVIIFNHISADFVLISKFENDCKFEKTEDCATVKMLVFCIIGSIWYKIEFLAIGHPGFKSVEHFLCLYLREELL